MPQSSPTLHRFATEDYLPWAAASKRSWRVDERILRQHVLPWLGRRQLGSIAAADLQGWFVRLAASGLAPATCNRILAVVKKLFTHAQALGLLRGSSPAQGLRFLRVPPRAERFLNPDEARKLASELKASGRPEALAALLLLHTGARKSEILKARWENIDLRAGVLTVPLAKSGRQRHVLLSAEACRIISGLPSRGHSVWLFPGKNPDRPLADIYRFWDQLRRRLGLEKLRLHDLRHTFASLVVNAGNSLYYAQRLLGHLSPATTMRYAHLERSGLLGICNGISHALTQDSAWGLKAGRRTWTCGRPWKKKGRRLSRIMGIAGKRGGERKVYMSVQRNTYKKI